MTFDLLNTKDTGLVGAVGEIIAWQHLWENGIIGFSFGQGRPWFTNKLVEQQLTFHYSGLKKKQLNYLNNLKEHGPRRWDFIGTRPREHGKRNRTVYLIEVKVRRQGKSRHDLRGTLKGKIPQDLEMAKSLGFSPLLLVVDMLDNWRFEVTSTEL